MFLTEIKLWDEYAARLIPKDAYGWHKVIWTFFPHQEHRDFLYRVDYNPSGVRLYVLSSAEPTPPDRIPPSLFRTREIPDSFLQHKRYRFQVRVNPTKRSQFDSRTGQRKEKGLRVPLTSPNEQLDWFARKSAQGGFSIPHLEQWPADSCPLSIVQEGRQTFRKPGQQTAHHTSVQFSGILTVTDEQAFRHTFLHGIGSAKSFGFGLLMLQPLS